MMNDYVRPASHALVGFDQIELPETTRPYVPEEVVKLKASIEAIGLQTPLTVVECDIGPPPVFQLIAGRHRLEALRLLRVERVPVRIVDMNDAEARMWTISENLHRAELTVVQRAQQVAEWVKLAEEQRALKETMRKLEPKFKAREPDARPAAELPLEFQSSQVETIESKRADGRGHRPESGINAAARELGMSKSEAHRAMKIAAIVPAAQDALHAAKLDNNQGVALKVASYADEDQVEAVAEIVATREARSKAAQIVDDADRLKSLRQRAEKSGYRIARRGSSYRLIGKDSGSESECPDLDEVEAMLDTHEGRRAMRVTSPCGSIVYGDNSEVWLAAHPGATMADFNATLPPVKSTCAASSLPAHDLASPPNLRPAGDMARPLRNLVNISAGEFAGWIKITTPSDRPHVIKMLRMAADILDMELNGEISAKTDAPEAIAQPQGSPREAPGRPSRRREAE